MQLQIFISLDISNSSNNTGKELSNNYRINLPFQNLITCFVSSNSVTQGNHNYVSLQHKMLVKCAVQVNQRYEEINLTQFLLLMNFSISCELLSVACAGQSSSSSSFAASLSPMWRGHGVNVFVESCVPWPWIRTRAFGVMDVQACVWAELECKHPKVRQAEPGTATAAQGLPLTALPQMWQCSDRGFTRTAIREHKFTAPNHFGKKFVFCAGSF